MQIFRSAVRQVQQWAHTSSSWIQFPHKKLYISVDSSADECKVKEKDKLSSTFDHLSHVNFLLCVCIRSFQHHVTQRIWEKVTCLTRRGIFYFPLVLIRIVMRRENVHELNACCFHTVFNQMFLLNTKKCFSIHCHTIYPSLLDIFPKLW